MFSEKNLNHIIDIFFIQVVHCNGSIIKREDKFI